MTEKIYEGMYLFQPELDSPEKTLEELKAKIEEFQGQVHKTFDRGLRKLAYPIRRFNSAYDYVIFFSIPPKRISELWKLHSLDKKIVRFHTLLVEKTPESLEFPTRVLR